MGAAQDPAVLRSGLCAAVARRVASWTWPEVGGGAKASRALHSRCGLQRVRHTPTGHPGRNRQQRLTLGSRAGALLAVRCRPLASYLRVGASVRNVYGESVKVGGPARDVVVIWFGLRGRVQAIPGPVRHSDPAASIRRQTPSPGSPGRVAPIEPSLIEI